MWVEDENKQGYPSNHNKIIINTKNKLSSVREDISQVVVCEEKFIIARIVKRFRVVHLCESFLNGDVLVVVVEWII